MKNDRKGFTLVELLASLVILGLLTVIAAPNIVGILQRTKIGTYVDDATKLATLAQYKFRGDSSIKRPSNNNDCIVISMDYLGSSEFKNAPYGGTYDTKKSFVVIQKNNNSYKYYVQLEEEVNEKGTKKYYGIRTLDINQLKEDNIYDFVETKLDSSKVTELTETTSSLMTKDGNLCSGRIVKRYV